VLTLIPIANFFVMPVAVAGATAMWVKEWREDHLRGASTAQSG
jgi:uncharacterized protein involved in cysteine biosynthesis